MRKKPELVWNLLCRTYRHCRRGVRGAISLFLAMVLLPFLSIALLLVESARYQSAVALVEELMDAAGLSTLSDYDPYLEERFGLLALTQENDPAENYRTYLTANVPALTGNFTYTAGTAAGIYPLSDLGVLKQQLLEYSEISVGLEAVYNALDIDQLLKFLSETLKLDELNKWADATTKVANATTSAADLINAGKDLIGTYNTYSTALEEYRTAASDFQTKAEALLSALYTAEAETGDAAAAYDDSSVKDAITELEKARDTYKTEAAEMSSATSKLKTGIEKIFSTTNSITKNVHEANVSVDKLGEQSALDICTQSTGELVIEVANEITNALNKTLTSTYSIDMQQQVEQLAEQQRLLGKVVCDQVPGTERDDQFYYIDSTSDLSQIKRDFAVVSFSSVSSNFGTQLQNALNQVNASGSGVGEEQRVGLGKLLDVAMELLGVTVFWDGSLDANVADSAVYAGTSVSISDMAIITTLTSTIQSGQSLVDSIGNGDILGILTSLGSFLTDVASCIVSIVLWAGTFLANVVRLVSSGGEIYDSFLLSAYGVYNMPCRTTLSNGKSLSSFSYSQIFEMQGGTEGNRFTGAMDDLKTLVASPGSGTDSGFRGAEAEYLLVGSNNELLNQGATFFNLYMLRLLMDVGPILMDKQVGGMAAAANVAGWAVYLAIIVAEPMIDALMLVNRESLYLKKNQIYLTPSGMVLLMETLPNLTGLSDAVQADILDCMVAKNGQAKASGSFKMNYQEHLLLLLLLNTSQDEFLLRMRNLIQMEAKKKYELEYDFSIDRANTYLISSVSGTLNSMFDMDSLTRNGPFSIHETRYMGY